MEQKLVNIGDKTYKCKIPKSEEEFKQGLMYLKTLPPDEGMLFDFKDKDTPKMWMKNTNIPLDMIAIDFNDEVITVYPAQPLSEELIPFIGARYILEVNQNSGIQIGDDFEIDESDDLDKYVMKVIAPDGGTRTLIRKAKKAELVKNDKESFEKACKSLGKYMFKVLYGQDHRDSEYVEIPK